MIAPPVLAPSAMNGSPMGGASRLLRHIRVLAGSLKPTAGSHIYNRELIRRLSARGHRVSVVAFDDGDASLGDVEICTLQKRPFDTLPFLWRAQTLLQAADFRRQLRRLPLDRPDIVIASEHLLLKPHALRFPTTPWLYLPHSWTIGEEIESYGLAGALKRLTKSYYVGQQRWAATHATRVVRFNQAAGEALRRSLPEGTPAAKLAINPPGIDLPRSTPAERIATPGRPLRLLFVGRLAPSKNVDFLLQTVSALRGKPWTLDIVGDGPQRSALEEEARRLGLASRVQFHGHQADVAAWYARSDLLAFPSKLESMGLAILEAMSHGVPALVIAGDGRQYRNPFTEVIDDGADGYVAVSETEFPTRLCSLLDDPSSLKNVSQAARRRVETTYCWDRHLDRFEQLFDEALASPAPRFPSPPAAR